MVAPWTWLDDILVLCVFTGVANLRTSNLTKINIGVETSHQPTFTDFVFCWWTLLFLDQKLKLLCFLLEPHSNQRLATLVRLLGDQLEHYVGIIAEFVKVDEF